MAVINVLYAGIKLHLKHYSSVHVWNMSIYK